MKTIIIFLLATVILYSQTREPSQHTFYRDGNPFILDTQNDYFKLDKFQLGWHWGSQRKISNSLLMNQADVNTETGKDPGELNANTNYYVRSYYDTIINSEPKKGYLYSHAYYDDEIMFTNGITFDPSLYVEPFRLYKREGDPQNPVFGFLYSRGKILNDSANLNYSRLIIDTSSLINKIVLKDPWPNDQLTFRRGEETPQYDSKDTPSDSAAKRETAIKNTYINTNFSGGTYYVSINLRRIGGNLIQDDTPVLKIEVPFVYSYPNNSTEAYGNAVFDQVPGTNYSMLPNGRGNVLDLVSAGVNGKDTMIITRRMLPLLHEDNGDITISGYIDFRKFNPPFYPPTPPFNLPLRESINGLDSGFIDQLNLKVTYLGNCDLAIDWIRFETPNTRRLQRGEYDELIKQGIQNSINKLSEPNSHFNIAGNKMYRFIINVEGGVRNWPAERYMRKLMGNIITGQNDPSLPNHYDHYVNPADKWYSYFKHTPMVGVPFSASNKQDTTQVIRDGDTFINNNAWKTFGFHQGYVKHPKDTLFNIFNSGYETYLKSGLTAQDMRTALMSTYLDLHNVVYAQGRTSEMAYWEYYQYKKLFGGMFAGYEFSDKPWFCQTFIQSFTKFDAIHNSNDSIVKYSYINEDQANNCNITGEQFRLMNWNPIILGAKGLMYDGDFDYPNQVKLLPLKDTIAIRRPGYDTLDAMSFLTLPEIDNDFLDESYNHILPDNGGLLSSIYDISTVATTMGTIPSRIYMGKRSIRMEMRKLHEWIRNSEDLLMALKLQAWYSIGYKLWYKQHPSILQSDIMSKYIDKEGIKTRRFFDVDSSGYKTTEPDYESTYETFADVTLLADTSDIRMIQSFTLGVQNKRTDPLIYFTEKLGDEHILFLPTAEFDYLCRNGGKNPLRLLDTSYPANVWQSYFWKRFGARELSVPFSFPTFGYSDSRYLRIKELGVENYDSLGDWYETPYYHRIDTVMNISGTLISNHSPGQGKMIRVERHSVFYEEGEPEVCNICNVIDSSSFVNITLTKVSDVGENCCYDVILHKTGGCALDSIPLRVIVKGGDATFDGLGMMDSSFISGKYINSTLSVGITDDHLLGTLCVERNDSTLSFEIVFGKDTLSKFLGCNRKFAFRIACDEVRKEAVNCCDLFTVNSSYHPLPPPPALRLDCCTEIRINNWAENDCIKSISLDRYGTGNYTNFEGYAVSQIFSNIGSHLLTTICEPVMICTSGSTLFPKERDLIFRGVDGEIICIKKVQIYYCCDIIIDPGPIDPTNRHSMPSGDVNYFENSKINLEIIPNPNHGYAKLGIKSEVEFVANIKIVSLTGEIVKRFDNIAIKPLNDELELNLTDLDSGSYYLMLESEIGTSSINIIKLK